MAGADPPGTTCGTRLALDARACRSRAWRRLGMVVGASKPWRCRQRSRFGQRERKHDEQRKASGFSSTSARSPAGPRLALCGGATSRGARELETARSFRPPPRRREKQVPLRVTRLLSYTVFSHGVELDPARGSRVHAQRTTRLATSASSENCCKQTASSQRQTTHDAPRARAARRAAGARGARQNIPIAVVCLARRREAGARIAEAPRGQPVGSPVRKARGVASPPPRRSRTRPRGFRTPSRTRRVAFRSARPPPVQG